MITTDFFVGTDANLETSLFEYGLLVSKTTDKDNQHACIYILDLDVYGVGYLSEKEVNNFLEESWFDKIKFLSYVGMDENGWLLLSIVNKISNLISYYGVENIFGTDYDPFTEDEAIVWLNDYKFD